MSLIISALLAHLFCYSLLACVLALFAVPIFNYFLAGDVFILFVVIVNFVFIAARCASLVCVLGCLPLPALRYVFFSQTPFCCFYLAEVPRSTSYICFTLAVLVLVVSQFLLPRSVPFKVRSFSF